MKITEQHHSAHHWLILLLLFVDGKSQEVPRLNCTYDSLATITCNWTPDLSLIDAQCSITGTVTKGDIRATCHLSSGAIPRSCELILANSRKIVAVTVAHRMNLLVNCMTGVNRTTEHKVEEILNYSPYYNLILSPPISLKISNSSDGCYNLTWSCEHSHYFENNRKYEVRYKPTQRKQWMDTLIIEQEQRWVTIQGLLPDTEYEAQVRVNQTRFHSSQWSKWSYAIVWITSKPDVKPSGKKEEDTVLQVLVPCVSIGAVIALVVAGFCASKWFKRILYVHIPDPAKFFNPINSEHGDSFQKWFAPSISPSFFASTEVLPEISPVEIAPKKFVPKELFLPTTPQDTSGQSSSSFINQGYFFFRYPNSFKIDSCQIYFTYEPFSNESSSSETSPSYGAVHSSGAKDNLPLYSAEVITGHTAEDSMMLPNYFLQDDPQHMPADFSYLFQMSPSLALTGNSAKGMQKQAGYITESRNNLETSHLLFTPPVDMLDGQRTEGEADGITESVDKAQLQYVTSHIVDGDTTLVPSSVQGFSCCCRPPSLNLVNRDYLTLNELQGQYGSHSV